MGRKKKMTDLEINDDIELTGGRAQLFIDSLNRGIYSGDKRFILRIPAQPGVIYDICQINGTGVIINYDSDKGYVHISFATEDKNNIQGALEGLIEMTGFNGLSFGK